MKRTTIAMLLSCAIGGTSFNALAAGGFTPEQTKTIEQVVHDYLVNNPEVLLEASQALQHKQQQTMQQQVQKSIVENEKALFSETLSVVGNPKGDVTIVEFFDYQCIHCKKMAPVLSSLLKKDKNLRVVYREFPIFGKVSNLASQAALAAAMQGKYQEMHHALLMQDKKLNKEAIIATAKALKLDINKLKKDMDGDVVKKALESNRALAESMHLMGTPAFIVASTPNGQFNKSSEPVFIPGAASEETMQSLIEKMANSKS